MTGMPIVDSLMREMKATGYMSYRGRQITAIYFARYLREDLRHDATWF